MSAQSQNDTDIKQCVLIAEPFSSHFDSNPVFLDFNSVSPLEFNLNWLVHNAVKECFVLYSSSKDQVEKYLSQLDIKEMKVIPMHCDPSSTKTLGCMLRELYFHQTLSGDFLLVLGNVVSNMNLKAMWRQHMLRKELSKMNVMTIVFEQCSSDDCFVIDQSSQEILQMHDFTKKFELNFERIKISKSLEHHRVRGDVSQAGVYACSLEVVKSFQETYEYQTVNDFISGMLTSELYTEKIYGYMLKSTEKCTLIAKPFDYYKAYDQLLSRYYYPFLVERPPQLLKNKLPPPLLKYLDYNKYIKADIPLRNIKIKLNSYIGEGCQLQPNTEIFKTILCRNATVEGGCKLKYCLIMEDTVVPANFKAENCLLKGKGDTFATVSWQDTVEGKGYPLETEQLFPEEDVECMGFEDELKIILSETPSKETYEELSSLRKHYSKKCREFATAIIVGLKPQTKEDINKIISEWGELLQRTCQDVNELLSAVADACQTQQHLQSKFPHFLLYLYNKEMVTDIGIVSWFDGSQDVQEWKLMLEKSSELVDRLREDQQSDEEQL